MRQEILVLRTVLQIVDVKATRCHNGSLQVASIEPSSFDGMPNLQTLALAGNRIERIDEGDFDGLVNLLSLDLSGNGMTNVGIRVFDGMPQLQSLLLNRNQITTLDLTRAHLEEMNACTGGGLAPYDGFCVDSREITSLILNEALLSRNSFDAIVKATDSISSASLIGVTFSDNYPADLTGLLALSTLENVVVDQGFFDLYSDELRAFDAMKSKRVNVVPETQFGLCSGFALIVYVLRRNSVRESRSKIVHV